MKKSRVPRRNARNDGRIRVSTPIHLLSLCDLAPLRETERISKAKPLRETPPHTASRKPEAKVGVIIGRTGRDWTGRGSVWTEMFKKGSSVLFGPLHLRPTVPLRRFSETMIARDSHFLFEQESGEVTSLARSCWIASAFSERSPNKITPNEDAVAILPLDEETAVFAIADGCGGMRGGEVAASLSLRCLADSVALCRDNPQQLRTAILDGIELANHTVQDLKIGAACTIAVAEFHQGWIRTYHVGDSTILLATNRGRVRYQSICHSPVGFAVEAGFLEPNQAMHHEDRHLVSNVVGDPRMRIEMGPRIEMGVKDTLVIASDGLFDNLTVEEVVERIRKGRLAGSLHSLTADARSRMRTDSDEPSKPDDLSVVCVRRV